jgi:hypothetical protein
VIPLYSKLKKNIVKKFNKSKENDEITSFSESIIKLASSILGHSLNILRKASLFENTLLLLKAKSIIIEYLPILNTNNIGIIDSFYSFI